MNYFEYCKEIRKSGLSSKARLVLRTMADYKDWPKDGKVWPSLTTLTADTGMSRRTIQRAIEELLETSWIILLSSTPTSNKYHLQVPARAFADVEVWS